MNTQQQTAYKMYLGGEEHMSAEQIEDALLYSMQRETYHAHSIFSLAHEVSGGVITMKELATRLEQIGYEMLNKNIIEE